VTSARASESLVLIHGSSVCPLLPDWVSTRTLDLSGHILNESSTRQLSLHVAAENSQIYSLLLHAELFVTPIKMLDFNFHLTTPRLYISHLDPSNEPHCIFMYDLFLSPGIVNDLPPADKEKFNKTAPREAGGKFIADRVEKMEKTGYGPYLISLKPSPSCGTSLTDPGIPFSQQHHEPIGVVSMQHARFFHTPGPKVPDVGFGLLSRYFGKGYAVEAAEELMRYFEEERGQKQFCAFCRPENEASKSVLRKLGLEERGVRELDGVVEGVRLRALVWTRGIGSEEGVLEILGM
jgi:RimJ/RimL family protein N-acetyltransferase